MPVPAKPTVLQAVQRLYAELGNGMPTLWLDEVPEGQGYPRAILVDSGQRPTIESYTRTDDLPAEVFANFQIFFKVENDSDTAEALAITVMQAFTPNAIQLKFDPTACMWRENYQVTGTGERSPDDKPVYQAQIDYKVEMSTNY